MLPLMLEYFAISPYAIQNNLEDYDALIEHFKHRQELELRIIKEIIGEKAMILKSKEWTKYDLEKLLHSM